jgi:hypothetical protein
MRSMSMPAAPNAQRGDLPAADARLVAPESRYEIEDGRVRYVSPSDEPHGTRHSKISALLEAHASGDYEVASDMLTRTSEVDDVAPGASLFPSARNPETGGRQLEELAFEVVSTETLNDAARKASKLVGRGVRRVFAIDVARQRALEWSAEQQAWRALDRNSAITDRALAAALPVEALVHAAKADDAMARALLAKKNPVLEAALAAKQLSGKAEALLAVLAARGLPVSATERARILAERDESRIEAWLVAALGCSAVSDLLNG